MAEVRKPGSEELSGLIRGRRQELGMSRRDLADATELSYPYISQLETGYRLPSHRVMQVLGKALQVDPAELFEAVASEQGAGRIEDQAATKFLANPTYDLAPPDPVAAAVEALRSVPVGRRLQALSRVQEAVVASVVEERSATA